MCDPVAMSTGLAFLARCAPFGTTYQPMASFPASSALAESAKCLAFSSAAIRAAFPDGVSSFARNARS